MIVEMLGNAGECWPRLLNALQTAGAADGPQDEFCCRTEEPVPSAVRWLGIMAKARGVHASTKVPLQRTAHPFPDGRGAWAVAGAVAQPDRCLSRQGPHRKKRRTGSDHADAGHDLWADVRHRRDADRSGADAGGRQLTASAALPISGAGER